MNNDILIVGTNQQLRAALRAVAQNNQEFKDIRILSWGQDKNCHENNLEINTFIKQNQPQYVIHMGLPRPLSTTNCSDKYPNRYKEHIDEVGQLLKTISELEIKPHYLYCSSSDIYDCNPTITIAKETSPLNTSKEESKCLISCENMIIEQASIHNIPSSIARLFESTYPNFFGKHPLYHYCTQINTIKWGIRPAEIWVGNLNSYYDFLEIKDVARALLKMVQNRNTRGEIYNVASGEASCLFDLVAELIRISGIAVDMHVDVLREELEITPNIIGNNQKIVTETSWSPEQTFISSLSNFLGENNHKST
ncbi:NAD-dependent epimerase/dehydratase family protein [Candidatus Ichthyocystis hellenicum]|uniref:NAD-dependent epimerase/dehydratase family protein n=1 Tax=Candidatus Ichthyocystis hellenicum TaxID=1561003 RepID=UPI000B81EA75|nr:NAD-dependent epimerase/dehydratase family protein [Candidatus Ichthyocystis hellenicum]